MSVVVVVSLHQYSSGVVFLQPYQLRKIYVTVHGKKAHLPQKLIFEFYISRECTMRALRDDANCSKIAYSVLELYTEICELRKTQ